jgi:hypothetical protein
MKNILFKANLDKQKVTKRDWNLKSKRLKCSTLLIKSVMPQLLKQNRK